MKSVLRTWVTLLLVASFSCTKAKDEPQVTPVFTSKPASLTFTSRGGSSTLDINMNGSKWVVTSDQIWCTVSRPNSAKAVDQITVTTTANGSASPRTARLVFTMDSRTTLQVTVSQNASAAIYPDYSNTITADASGMSSNARMLAARMSLGWNLGNSLEVPGDETGWGNPKATQRLIDSVKAAGINVVRLPCAWDSYLEEAATAKIRTSWLARVREVVDYCYKNDMYVIINIHWDGGWLENNPTYAKQAEVNAKQKALWEQIAVYFRDYDEHLLFAGTNEVHASTTATAENYAVQMSYNQTFVNAVRSTGGRNAYRNLIIQAYNTNIDQAVSNLVPSTDNVPDRLLVEVHYYDPWDFCGMEKDESWGTVKYFWGADFAQYGAISSWGQEDHVRTQFEKMKTNFVDKGYPVILGEFGASRRSSLTGSALEHHLASRAYYFQYVTQQAKNYGIVPFLWDNGFTGNLGMGIFNRVNGSVFDRQALNGLVMGASSGKYPF